MTLSSQDNYTRANQSGWGTASNGETWNQIDGTDTLAIASNAGTATGKVNTNSMQLGSQTAKDVEGLVHTSVSATNARSGVELRVVDLNNYYVARLNGSNNKVELCKQVAGTLTVLANASFTVTASTFYWLRFRVQGTTLEAQAWSGSLGSDPGGWLVSVTDSTFSAAGSYGVYANAGANATVISFSTLTITNLQDTLDIMMRAGVTNHAITSDIKMRTRIAGPSSRDIAMRARLAVFGTSSTKDIKMRARLSGFGNGDILMRACLAEGANALPVLAANVLTVTVSGTTYSILEGSFAYSETIDGRSICNFTIYDTTGKIHLQYRQYVIVTHSVRGVIFTGFVNTSQETNHPPNAANTLAVTCIDEHWIPDKRVFEGNEFANQYAGNIAAYLASQLAQDGITAAYAIDHDTTTADFTQGTLSGVVASSNVGGSATGDGDLELAAAGSTVTIAEGTANADYGFGNFNNTQTYGTFGSKVLVLLAAQAIKLTGTAAVPGGGNLFSYHKVWNASYTFQAGDTVNYDIWISSTSPQIQAGFDLVMTDGSTMRDISNQGCRDQQQLHAHPNADLSGFANDQWYSRQIGTSALIGKTTYYGTVVFEGNNIGVYTAYFRNIRILDSSGNVKQTIFSNTQGMNVSPAQQLQNQGYTGVSVSAVTVYQQNGNRISPAYSISGAGIARSSIISWVDTIPTDTAAKTSGAAYSVLVEASLDGGLTYQTCTNNQPIPGVVPGMLLTGKSLTLRETLGNTTTDPTKTPQLTSLQATIQPSYADNSKRDVVSSTATQAQWLAGTLTGGPIYTGGAFSINGYTRTWDNASTSGQTHYGANAPFFYVSARQLVLQCQNNADVRSRLDFAGQWQNFTAEVDINVGAFPDTAQNTGIVYRCTGWQNNNDTYAYSAYVNLGQIVLARGTNSSSGAGAFTTITSTGLTLSSGNTHRLKVVVNGNSHTVYLDDVQYLSATDSTYTAAGYLGLRLYNAAGNMVLTTPGLTAGTHYSTITVDYISEPIPDATAITIDIAGSGETVYAYGAQAAASGVTAIQITTNSLGSGHAQVNLVAAHNHATGALTVFPFLGNTSFDNFGVAANTSVVRVSPVVDLSSVVTAQDSYIGWTQSTPGSSTVLVEASIDNGASWHACTNGMAIGTSVSDATTTPPTYTLPSIARGYNMAGTPLQLRTTLATNSVTTLPTISDMTAWVIGYINSSGYRVSPPLSLSPVGRVGDSLVAWIATLPNDNTTLGIDVSPDGINWTDVSTSNGVAVPFINSRGTPYLDTFSANNNTAYTSSLVTGSNGSAAIWTTDTLNSRLIATGGVHALYSPNGLTFGDGEMYFDSDYADFGGCMWRLSSDLGTCYELAVQDSGAPRTPNVMRLYKVQGGMYTQLGQGVALSFTRGIPTRFKIVQKAGVITVTTSYPATTPDGSVVGGNTQTLTYTDPSPLAAGLVALRSNGGTNHYQSLQFVQFGDDVTNKSLYTRQRLSTTDPTVTPQVQDLVVSVHGHTIYNGLLIPATTYSTLSGSTNTIAQDLDDLAKQSNYWWRILQGVLYFQPTNGTPAPFPITNNDMLSAAKVTVTYNADLYRNEAIVIGGTDTVNTTINDIADGFATGFNTFDNLDSITSITVNGQLQSFGIQGVDTGKQWYYQQGKAGITQDPNGNPLAAGTTVSIQCAVQIQVIAKARNQGHINLLASLDNTSGVVTVVEQASGLNSASAQALALSRLTQYSTFSIDITFTTCRPGLHIGQLLTLSIPQHGLTDITAIITQVDYSEAIATINGTQTLLEYFKVACTTGPVVGNWLRLFS